MLRRALRDYDLSALALAGAARRDPTIASHLQRAGFEPAFEDAEYTLWVRPSDTPGYSK